MARILTVQNAEINTASITIRTLQIEGRQVTLAVFRQLPVEDIIDDDNLNLKGVGWGHVNYMIATHWRYSGRTIHLVWQKGNELRRCLVHQIMSPETFTFEALPREAKPETIRAIYADIEETQRKMADPAYVNGLEWRRGHLLSLQKNLDAAQAAHTRWQEKYMQAQNKHASVARWIERRNKLVIPLFDLPQLFVAV